MKRSKMIEIIAFNIAYQALASGNINVDISWINVDEILKEIENQGMLPPRAELPKLSISDNAWEPEDDKE
jgi:hypothetical protein